MNMFLQFRKDVLKHTSNSYKQELTNDALTKGRQKMRKIESQDALLDTRHNKFKSWNQSTSSSFRSTRPTDASCRIHDNFAIVNPSYSGPLFTKDAAVFAMGSCFAREIEAALIRQGGNVVSVDESIQIDEFRDGDGKIRNGFFHRFTPRSIWQEFMWCFDQLDNWETESLITGHGDNNRTDLNYWRVKGENNSLKAVLTRRKIAKELVRTAAKANIIILTLGLVEAWFHKPSGLYANCIDPKALARHSDEFELHLLDLPDTVQCLEEIYTLLHDKHETGNFRLIITVSPVPLLSTFTTEDVVIANATSKAILRASAAEFVSRHKDTDYFPSYEMVSYSARELAWRPDQIHVNSDMVSHIVSTFCKTYYETPPVTNI
jgi:hypothetical protein